MSLLAESIVVGAAAYRLWRLVAEDEVTGRLRDLIIRTDPIANLVECPWCLGSWITFALAGLGWALGWISSPVLTGLAGSVVCGWLGERL